jgi:hypothetical protein
MCACAQTRAKKCRILEFIQNFQAKKIGAAAVQVHIYF